MSVLSHSCLTASQSWSEFANFLPIRFCWIIGRKILYGVQIGTLTRPWQCQNMFQGLFLSTLVGDFCRMDRGHYLVENWLVCFFSPRNDFWRLGSNSFSHVFCYSLAVIDCSPHLIGSPIPADENVFKMLSGLTLSPYLWRKYSGASLQSSNLDSSLHRSLPNQSESKCNLCWMFFFDNRGFLANFLNAKSASVNLVMVLLETVLFSAVMNSSNRFHRLFLLSWRVMNFSRPSSLLVVSDSRPARSLLPCRGTSFRKL